MGMDMGFGMGMWVDVGYGYVYGYGYGYVYVYGIDYWYGYVYGYHRKVGLNGSHLYNSSLIFPHLYYPLFVLISRRVKMHFSRM